MDNFNYKKYLAEGGIHEQLQKATNKGLNRTTRFLYKQFTLERILKSGALLEEETNAIREFIEYRGNNIVLNENTIKMVDRELLDEGVIDWFKEKGKKVVDFVAGGWEKVKGAWNNFKDFVAGVIEQIKLMFQKAFEWVKGKAKDAFGWIAGIGKDVQSKFNEQPDDKQEEIKKDFSVFTDSTKFIGEYVKNLISGKGWEEKVASGDLTVKTEPKTDQAALETSEKNIEKLAESVFTNKEVIITLMEADFQTLNEGGMHPEDLLGKYPVLKEVLHYIVEGLKWVFNFPVKLAQEVIKFLMKNFFKGITWLSSKIGGPGPAECAALALVVAEASEVGGHNIHTVHEVVDTFVDWITGMIKGLGAWAGPFADGFAIAVTVVTKFAFFYAIATICLNLGKWIVKGAKAVAKAATDAAEKGGDVSGAGAGSGMGMRENLSPEFVRMQKLAGLK